MELVRTVTAAGVTTLTLDSPANRNALSSAADARSCSRRSARRVTDPAVRAVVLSHTGPVFCSGADLKETAEARDDRPGARRDAGRRAGRDLGVPEAGGRPGRRPGPRGWSRPDRRRRPRRLHTRRHVRVLRGAAGRDPGGDQCHRAAPARPARRRRALPDRRRLRRRTGRRDRPGHRRGRGRRSWTRRSPRYCDALVRGGPIALAGTKQLLRRPPGRSRSAPTWPSCRPAPAGVLQVRRGPEGVAAFREKRPASWVPVAR